ncbi:TetR/AcrR family transcriptional regulator [Alterisphingorhabdus coralli]|uniref:TetR/AcrR family transcriptional regulator n=1 Tax=Alterisphingorhabdus coralli TaxID=3071408 RepID=A0AA97F702_9SPHN|nr:TetR/AcrR family transcriptional regulator [Parasphingorhabdus sp. SCSIO 66989]WOE75534.1 TetR/AcrR family transcriptional regulator [Parasphingorhabdus sp. SCSIO 66989]
MTRREEAKAFNRARIRSAAEDIIRKQGIEALTMRHLAEEAGVSLRTPYNLFGSKTDVLVALLEDAEFDPMQLASEAGDALATAMLLTALDKIEAFFERDEAFYRDIYGAIMASDHQDARTAGVERVIASGRMMAAHALANGELTPDTDASELGRYLALDLLAMLGMWGGGFFSNRACMALVRRSWCGVLLNHCTETARPPLQQAYHQTLSRGE